MDNLPAGVAKNTEEDKYRKLFETSRDAIMLLDDYSFFDCNPAALQMFGYSTKEEFCTKHPSDISPPTQPDGTDSLTKARQMMALAWEKGSNMFEWMHQRSTGENFPAEVLLTAFNLGEKDMLQATVRDISERKNIENKLRDSENTVASVINATLDAIVMTDEKDHIELWNKATEILLGYTAEEMKGKEFHALIPFMEAHRTEKHRLSMFQQTGESDVIGKTLELPATKKDGTKIMVELTVSKTKLHGTWHAIGVMRDITRRKNQEKQLQEKLAELEQANKLMIGRELKMIELKSEIEQLQKK